MKVRDKSTKTEVDFAELNPGDCFRAFNQLYVKSEYQQQATGLENGTARFNMCGIKVIPVNAEVQIID